jgi:hypothetical protein
VLCDTCTAQIHPGQTALTSRVHLGDLDRLAEQLGIDGSDLDETVIDLCSREASDRYNSAEEPDGDGEEVFDRLHAQAEHRASGINNRGVAGQLEYLAASLGDEGGSDLLHTIAARPEADEQYRWAGASGPHLDGFGNAYSDADPGL